MFATRTVDAQRGGDHLELIDRLRRFDEDRVDTEVARGLGSADRLVEADRGTCVGASGDVQVRAVIECGPQLRQPLLTRHDLLAGHVPAPLGPHLVFEEDAGRPRGLPHLDGADDVERVAVARVAIHDDHRRRATSLSEAFSVAGRSMSEAISALTGGPVGFG